MSERATPEWDATSYHRLANPHVTWGQRVLARLPLHGDETVIDAGCGSGRLTAELLDLLPEGRVIAVDLSANMLAEAERHLRPAYGDRVAFLQSDLQDFRIDRPVDAIFSTAAFHWVRDHDRLWRALFQALKPGGWLVAQCGGGPNIARIRERTATLMRSQPYAGYFDDWPGPWEFASAGETARRLQAAGFTAIETSLEESPVVLADEREYRDYLRTVVFGAHLSHLPDDAMRDAFIDALTEQAATDEPPYSLDYWRLNIQTRRPGDALSP